MQQSDYENAKDAALKLLRNRDKTSRELRLYLEKKKYPDQAIAEVIEFLLDCGILDERRYSARYIEEAIRKRKGRRLIKSELSAKGVDRRLADELLEELLSRDQERENARIEAEKQLREGIDAKSLGKAMRHLAYLGYDSELIYDLMESLQYKDFYKQHLTS